MSSEASASLCAGIFCLLTWSAMAAGMVALASWRMRRAERALGAPALPSHEWPLAWYAGAATVWPVAAVLALVGLISTKWARAGRNALLVLVAHFSVIMLAVVIAQSAGHRDPGSILPPLVIACTIVIFGCTLASVFAWRFASARVRRLEAPSEEPAPGLGERVAIYLASVFAWPAGLICFAMYSKPHNVRVGANALRFSLATILAIAYAVCTGFIVLGIVMPG